VADLLLSLLGLIVRIGLFLAGLVFFASLLAAALLVLAVWLVRALWAKLTGRPVSPWTFQINRRGAWDRFYRRSSGAAPARDDTVVDAQVRDVNVVTDVEPKRITPPGS